MIRFETLRERKLIQWGLAYLAGAWLVLQVAQLLGDAYDWPPSLLQALLPLLAVGFFGALVLAWYHGERGEQRVSGIELMMLVGILVLAGAALTWVRGSSQVDAGKAVALPVPLAVVEQGSIAVLPFVDMSAGGDNEYFSDGLTEELLNALAQLPELRVAARTSAFAFKDQDVGIDSIARALNVAHVLEGSVRKADQQVRITAQLIDTESGYHVWSETYDGDLADIFALQDSISRAIVEALEVELGTGREGQSLVELETTSPEAHTLVLRADHAAQQSTRESMEQAEAYLQQALELDPAYARVHALLADVHWYQAFRQWLAPAEGFALAEREAERALALDPENETAHLVLALIASGRDWDWQEAEAHFARAIETNPGYARAYDWGALLLAVVGRMDEAIESGRRSVALDPASAGRTNNLGEIYRYAGQPDRALEQYSTSLILQPDHPVVLGNVALTHAVAGDEREALHWAERAVRVAPMDGFALSTLAYVYARVGRHADARRTLAEMADLPAVSPYLLATVHTGLGDQNRALALLEQAVEERDTWVTFLGVDPVFDPHRDDPRTRSLLDRMGLP